MEQLARLWRQWYEGPHGRRVTLLASFLVGAIALQLAVPQVMRYIFDTAQIRPHPRPDLGGGAVPGAGAA